MSPYDKWIIPSDKARGSEAYYTNSTTIANLVLGEPAILDDLEYIEKRVDFLVEIVHRLLPQVIPASSKRESSRVRDCDMYEVISDLHFNQLRDMNNRRHELTCSINLRKTVNKVAAYFKKYYDKKIDEESDSEFD